MSYIKKNISLYIRFLIIYKCYPKTLYMMKYARQQYRQPR